MNKKALTVGVATAACVLAVAGGTLAYFTDADKDVNVMTAGNITIVQNETDRAGEAYEDGQALMPAVINGTLAYDGTMNNTNGKGTLAIWGSSVDNEIDKIISVTNKGTLPAYVRTIVLMENTADNAICEKIHGLWNNDDGQYRSWVMLDEKTEDMVKIGDTWYSIAVCTYDTALAAGATSSPSLTQVFLDPTAGNEWSALLGEDGKFSIIAISQAAQTTGFENADDALNTAFGEVNSTNVAKWFDETNVDTSGDLNVIGGQAQTA